MENPIAHSEVWGLAVIMIVVASWFLYRYLAPKTWREWVSAGIVQAFIIALYAEMYGFPLTIYLLVRFFGLDRPNLNASLWSTLFGFGELGMMIFMVPGYVLLFAGIGLFAQGWRELYRARQQRPARDGRIVRPGKASSVSGTVHRAFRRRCRALADDFLRGIVSHYRACLYPPCAKGRAADGRTIRG